MNSVGNAVNPPLSWKYHNIQFAGNVANEVIEYSGTTRIYYTD